MTSVTWNEQTLLTAYQRPLFDLVSEAYQLTKVHFDTRQMELCTLSSIKTGACPEDCAYCPQSGHYNTGLKKEKLRDFDSILAEAQQAKAQGASRFCMGAAWKNPPERDFPKVLELIKAVKAMGLEACVTLGMLSDPQAEALKAAGLDYYNHNLDTSPEYYKKIITTRTYADRLDTLSKVSQAGINVCCGGIIGMGETQTDRIQFLLALAALPNPPDSIPINHLIPIEGTPLADAAPLDGFEFVKTIAIARLMFPKARIRLSAGRTELSDELQAWCFMAGANSIFVGDILLTAANPSQHHDESLLQRLGYQVHIKSKEKHTCEAHA